MFNKTAKKSKKKPNFLSNNESKRQLSSVKVKNIKLSCTTRSKSLIAKRESKNDFEKLNINNKAVKCSLRLKKIEPPISYINDCDLQLVSRQNKPIISKPMTKMKKQKPLVEKENSTKNQQKTVQNKSNSTLNNCKDSKHKNVNLKSKKLFKVNKMKQFVDSKKKPKNDKCLKKENKLSSFSRDKNRKNKKTDAIKKKVNSSQLRAKANKNEEKKLLKDKIKISKNALLKRGHRVASLNAIAKVRLLCENEREKANDLSEIDTKPNIKDDKKLSSKCTQINGRKSSAVASDDLSKKQLVRKRKLSDKIEIIDTRSCKRMASLNASAIMAASYSPQKIKNKPIESTYSDTSSDLIKEMKISSTVSRIEISPTINVINGIHFAEAKSVILKAKSPEKIEFIDNLKVSNKIRERLLGIARLEDYENRKRKRKQSSKGDMNVSHEENSVSSEVSGFQSTKVQVTKVTQINTSQETKCDKENKSGHKIESILERDSSVVHKYQVQTKSTIQMATSFNPTTASNLANVCSLPQLSQTGAVPRFQLHISATPAQVIPTPILSTSTGHSTLNFSSPTSVQFYNNNQYQTMPSSGSHINPMSIVNFCETYPTHYTSAFSVPHFADHTHSQPLFNYFYPGIYQPAGPLLQPLHDSCLIHKPIPFHPQTSQPNHVHSSQFTSTPLQTQSGQTFQNDLQTQPLLSTTQILQQLPNSIRQPQTLFFQTLPQTNSSISPSATFAILNPNLQYTQPSQPSLVTEKYNELHPVCNESSNCLTPTVNNDNVSSFEQTSHNNSIEYLCKGIQCSPTRKDTYIQNQNSSLISSYDSTKSLGAKDMKTIASERSTIKRFKSSDSQNTLKRKKSMLLKPQAIQKAGQTITHEPLVSNAEPEPLSCNSIKNIDKSASTSNNSNTNNSDPTTQAKITKTLCVPVVSLASVSLPRFLPSKKPGKKRYSHGWSWEGEPTDKFIYVNNEDQPFLRKSYPAIRHNEGDIIKTRDCVLLRSGPKKTDLPFVAKIAALWETPDGEMMMSLLWYYRPEHTDLEYYSTQIRGEIFASKHRDTNSVACIDDKCYVLTYNEFCRYQRLKLLKKFPVSFASTIVPPLDEPYPRTDRLPPIRIFPELVFCCRKVYDYRQKRILKNPI